MVNYLAKVVAALYSVFKLREYLADLVFDSIGTRRRRFKFFEIRKQLLINKFRQVIARQRIVMIELAVLGLWRGPILPFEFRGNYRRISLARQFRRRFLFPFKIVEIFQKQNP